MGSGRAADRLRQRARVTTHQPQGQVVIKRELLPDGRQKLIVRDPDSGDFSDLIVAGG